DTGSFRSPRGPRLLNQKEKWPLLTASTTCFVPRSHGYAALMNGRPAEHLCCYLKDSARRLDKQLFILVGPVNFLPFLPEYNLQRPPDAGDQSGQFSNRSQSCRLRFGGCVFDGPLGAGEEPVQLGNLPVEHFGGMLNCLGEVFRFFEGKRGYLTRGCGNSGCYRAGFHGYLFEGVPGLTSDRIHGVL